MDTISVIVVHNNFTDAFKLVIAFFILNFIFISKTVNQFWEEMLSRK